jgi:hypothetical protein
LVWLPIDPHFQQNPRLYVPGFTWCWVLSLLLKGSLFSAYFLHRKHSSHLLLFVYFDSLIVLKKNLFCWWCCNIVPITLFYTIWNVLSPPTMDSSSMTVEKLDFPWCKLHCCFDNCCHIKQNPNIMLLEVLTFRITLLFLGFLVGAWVSSLFFPLSQNMCGRAGVGLNIHEESTIPVLKKLKLEWFQFLSLY